MNVEQIILTCQQERQAYSQTNNATAPICIQTFRLAFSGDAQAWTCLYKVFKSQIKQWIGTQSILDPEDVLQDAWLSFARYAPRSKTLTATDSLGPVLSYLRRCVKTTLVDQMRALKRRPQAIVPIDMIDEPVTFNDPADQVTSSVTLQDRIDHLITDETEKLLFQLRIVCHMPPREIFAQHPDRFKDRRDITIRTFRLIHRLRQDPILIEMYDSSKNAWAEETEHR